MASFHSNLPILLRFEGRFVDDPADPGGATNKGITLQTCQANARQLRGVEPTLEKLKSLSDARAGTLMRNRRAAPRFHIPLGGLSEAKGPGLQARTRPARRRQRRLGAPYKALCWDRARGDEIGLRPLADPLVDFHVNAGGNALEVLQQVLNNLGTQPPLERFTKGWLNRVTAFPVL